MDIKTNISPPSPPTPMGFVRGAGSTLVQKVALFVQTALAAAILAYCLTSPQLTFRWLALPIAILTACILALMFWTHFLARPAAGPAGRAPHFSGHVWIGLLLLFLGVTGAAIYYVGGLTRYTIAAQEFQWSPITFPLEPWAIILWATASLAFGVTQARRTL